jgi:PAS domain S-box-containing protein
MFLADERAILIVSQAPERLEFLSSFLADTGYRVCTARDAQEGFSVAKGERQLDLVIGDAMAPFTKIIELCRLLRADAQFYTTPILIIGSKDADGLVAFESLMAGADDYVEKPCDRLHLIAKVSRLVERKQVEDALRRAHEDLERRVKERTLALSQANAVLKEYITERQRVAIELQKVHSENARLLAAIPSILIGIDELGRIMRWNQAARNAFGLEEEAVIGRALTECGIQWDKAAIDKLLVSRDKQCPTHFSDIKFKRSDGKEGFLEITITPFKADSHEAVRYLLIGADITERRILESQLRQAQKLESIGQLAAGIAHEINTPTQYVGDNTRFLRDAFADLSRVLSAYAALLAECRDGAPKSETIAWVEAELEKGDLENLLEEIPKAIQQSLEGIERIAKIVQSMKDFAHPGATEKKAVDLNKAIESTITVARNEWKYVADMITDFDPTLPPVLCLQGEFNQVILNMIINAAHAIADKVGKDGGQKGIIKISTRRDGEWAEIRISDTGTGIPSSIQSRIFDPFFTTKEVGRGTGQGLAISHSVIVEKHGGTISFETEEGQGTTFIIRLPIGGDVEKEAAR